MYHPGGYSKTATTLLPYIVASFPQLMGLISEEQSAPVKSNTVLSGIPMGQCLASLCQVSIDFTFTSLCGIYLPIAFVLNEKIFTRKSCVVTILNKSLLPEA